MDKDHLPLLEDQNPLRRSEIFAGSRSATLDLTEAIKSLSNVSGREADVHWHEHRYRNGLEITVTFVEFFSNDLIEKFKSQSLRFVNLNDDFALRMAIPQIGQSFLCFCKSKYLVDHGLDFFIFHELTDLIKLIAIRADKKK